MTTRIIRGDVLRFAAHYRGPKFHALLCDPPYHLTSGNMSVDWSSFPDPGERKRKGTTNPSGRRGFMGKSWDGGDVAHDPETWAALGSLMLPGAFGMAFASSRGWHRLACAIEDAGMVIHPSIFGWVQGQGFPKATRINAPDFDGHRYGLQALKPALEPIIVWQKPYPKVGARASITATGAGALWVDGGRIGTSGETWGGNADNAHENYSDDVYNLGVKRQYAKPSHPQGRWPANFYLSHLPGCNGTCADGCPVAGLGVDSPVFLQYNEEKQECELCGVKLSRAANMFAGRLPGSNTSNLPIGGSGSEYTGQYQTGTRFIIKTTIRSITLCPTCRWSLPNGIATIISDLEKTIKSLTELKCENVSVAESISRSIAIASARLALITDIASCANVSISESGAQEIRHTKPNTSESGVSASVSRFFFAADFAAEVAERIAAADPVLYQAKAGRRERDAGLDYRTTKKAHSSYGEYAGTPEHATNDNAILRNGHPCIKPIALARWLATLLLPPAPYAPRRVLVPFAGSGSEMIGAALAGWDEVVGIEREREYVAIAQARITHHLSAVQMEMEIDT